MKQSVSRRQLLSTVATAAALSPIALFAEAPQEVTDGKPYFHIRSAIKSLHMAKKELAMSGELYGEHKKKGMELADQTIQELTVVIEMYEAKSKMKLGL